MRRASRLFHSALMLSLLAACADPGSAGNGQCVMREIASLPVLNDLGQPIVKVGINGTPVAFMIDTGARLSMMTTDATDRLGLPVDRDNSLMLEGAGGSVLAYKVEIRSLDLGTAAAHHIDLYEVGRLRRGDIDGLSLSGLFGGDFLVNYDVDFDLPAHRVSLYAEQHCGRDFPQPWRGIAFRQPFALEAETQIDLDARINGAPVRLQLDSGARTLLDLNTAARAGVTPAMMTSDRTFITRGIDDNPLTAKVHRFDSFQIGDERITRHAMAVADIQSNPLLGADFLRANRVWVSYPHELLWIQPVGRYRLAPDTSPTAAPHG